MSLSGTLAKLKPVPDNTKSGETKAKSKALNAFKSCLDVTDKSASLKRHIPSFKILKNLAKSGPNSWEVDCGIH